MSQMSDYLEGQIRAHVFRTATFTKPTVIAISLHTADPGETGASEVSGGAYARVTRNPLDANWTAASATDGLTDNAAAVTFPAPVGANWGVITHFGVWDAASAGNYLTRGPVTPNKTVNDGDAAPSFAIGALDIVFA
jgi:hypothetical protein